MTDDVMVIGDRRTFHLERRVDSENHPEYRMAGPDDVRGAWTKKFLVAYQEMEDAVHDAGLSLCGMCDRVHTGDGSLCRSCSNISF